MEKEGKALEQTGEPPAVPVKSRGAVSTEPWKPSSRHGADSARQGGADHPFFCMLRAEKGLRAICQLAKVIRHRDTAQSMRQQYKTRHGKLGCAVF